MLLEARKWAHFSMHEKGHASQGVERGTLPDALDGHVFPGTKRGTLLEVRCGAPFSRCGKRRTLRCVVGDPFPMHRMGTFSAT